MNKLLFILLLFFGCDLFKSKDANIGEEIIPGRNIYIVGSYGGSACYWLNGSRIELTGGDRATDVVVVLSLIHI